MSRNKLKAPLRHLGLVEGLYYLASRVINKISFGRARLIRYHIVAQPVPIEAPANLRPDGGTVIAPVGAGDALCAEFPRPPAIIAARYSNGNTCLAAKVKGHFAGFLWYAHHHYEEDEVRCRFEIAEPKLAVWDYDVYVEPQYRLGRTLGRLWAAAHAQLRAEGIRWSFSRISTFNPNSLHSHARLGARNIGTLTFLTLGQAQLTFGLTDRRIHYSASTDTWPEYRLHAPQTLPPHSPGQPLAVVVGTCAHGLGMIRGLARAGVPVVALESDPSLPGNRTRCATIRHVPDINGPGLIQSLKQLAKEIGGTDKPVLVITNDTMSKTIGEHVEEISPHYRLSWADCAPRVLELLSKEHIEQRCRAAGLNYPKSVLISQLVAIEKQLEPLRYPIIFKPTRPLSAFKTLVLHQPEALAEKLPLIGQCLPVLAQEFIPGDDRCIRFGALYLHRGQILARFEGRKLCSRPMGLTTVAVSEPNDAIHQLAARFFAGLEMSGPVSLELKQAPDGTHWVMEPTVGRTDFWEGLCSANGVNLPLIEYCTLTGRPLPDTRQQTTHLWINGERQHGVLLWLLTHAPGLLVTKRLRGVYYDPLDPQPYRQARNAWLFALPLRVTRKIRKLLLAPDTRR